MKRAVNFNAGPATMPVPVLEEIQRDLLDYRGTGISVLEMSHRSSEFADIAGTAEADLRALLSIPDNYDVLFMQGGASAQFALTVQNLDHLGHVAYANTGYWSARALSVAESLTKVTECCTLQRTPEVQIPAHDHWHIPADASYLHITDNETIDGVAFDAIPETVLPIVCDMSSSILSKPVDMARYGLIYAGAQKNIGPAGLTLVIVRREWLEHAHSLMKVSATGALHRLPASPVFDYVAMQQAGSLLNTPPVFAWYAAGLVFRWLRKEGGVEVMAQRNRAQAKRLYQCIDELAGFENTVAARNRSIMNIPFTLTDASRTAAFLDGAKAHGMIGLKGHKSTGGIRASLYNASSDESLDALIDYMTEFARKLP